MFSLFFFFNANFYVEFTVIVLSHFDQNLLLLLEAVRYAVTLSFLQAHYRFNEFVNCTKLEF